MKTAIAFCNPVVLIRSLAASLLLVSAATLSFGQTLNFNQVIVVDSGTVTVPASKVWKVEKVLVRDTTYIKFINQSGGTCGCSSSGGTAHMNYENTSIDELTKNNVVINGNSYIFDDGSPLWLPAGTTLTPTQITTPVQDTTPSSGCYCPYWIDGAWVGYGPYTPPQVTVRSLVSIIEFNVVP